MEFKVNKEQCIGCELCEQICSEVFIMDDDGLAIVDPTVSETPSSAMVAKESCPVEAIEIITEQA